ncbi:hypothetical protein B4U79_11241, partial [Dinothrombium tinctorium]
MQIINLPDYTIKWVISFLKNRKFPVKINENYSDKKESLSGVPQESKL